MKIAQMHEEFATLVAAPLSLNQVAQILRNCKSDGLSQSQAQEILERLRGQATDEAAEDRILEVLDIVSGYCSQELTVWD